MFFLSSKIPTYVLSNKLKIGDSSSSPGGVVVVNSVADSEEEVFTFKLPFKPLIPVGHEALPSTCVTLGPDPFINLGLALEGYFRNKAETVTKNQSKIIELMREVDSLSSNLAHHTIEDKEKRLSKVVNSLEKLKDIEKLLARGEASLESCLSKIDLLNKSLPPQLKLEELSGKSSTSH